MSKTVKLDTRQKLEIFALSGTIIAQIIDGKQATHADKFVLKILMELISQECFKLAGEIDGGIEVTKADVLKRKPELAGYIDELASAIDHTSSGLESV